jgi:hypothetical protein
MPSTTSQSAPAQEAGRAQPQTTVQAAGGPFIRHSQPGIRLQYQSTGNALGGIITQPLVATPGYFRKFRVRVAATGGTGTTTVAAAADAPFSAIQSVIVKDAFGTPLLVGPGYEMLRLWPKYSGGHYTGIAADPTNLPSYSALTTGASATGAFTFQTAIPLEFVKGYGCISGANASLLPSIQWNLGASSAIYTTAPNTTAPVIEVDVDSELYWLPEGVSIEPPGLGTTRQAVLQFCNPTFSSGATTTVALPRLGGFIDTLIFVIRDSNGARQDAWPTSRIRFYLDGVPVIDARVDELYDDMYNTFNVYGVNGGYSTATRETGVLVLSRKTSLAQDMFGLLDSSEATLSTNPGTLIQVEGAPWGSGGTGPYTLGVIAGQIVPSGSLIQGLPEV